MMFSVPAVKGVEIGTGFRGINLKGSAFNDVMMDEKGTTKTNHSGGISGGISNGNDLVVRVMIKPASSIGKPQETYHFEKNTVETLDIGGRHDVAIARRAGIVLESMLAICLADMYLIHKAYQ
jgi:chorismate synthase